MHCRSTELMIHRLRRWHSPVIAGALAWALLLGQALGLLHGTAHMQTPAPGAVALQPTHGDSGAEHHDLFAGHQQGSDVCELLDQIGYADALPLATLAEAQPAIAQHANAATTGGVAPRWASAYRARAPPSILV
jgi:hypothetical protein